MEAIKESAEEMFQQYLQMTETNPDETPPGTLDNMRKCFYGALGMHSVLIMELGNRKNLKRLNLVMNRIKTDVWRYWRAQGANIFK